MVAISEDNLWIDISEDNSRLASHNYRTMFTFGFFYDVVVRYFCSPIIYLPKVFLEYLQIQTFIDVLPEHPLHSHGLIDAPKVLADVVESTLGAVFIDSDCSIDTTWKVIFFPKYFITYNNQGRSQSGHCILLIWVQIRLECLE